MRHKIVESIKAQLVSYPSFIEKMDELKECPNYLHYLLKITAQFNLLKEMHELLSTETFSDINQSLQLHKSTHRDHGKTLLGIAAYHGHYPIVCYLIEVRGADHNARDTHGNTALHQVALGDLARHKTLGYAHEHIAEYLVNVGAHLEALNNEQKTPLDLSVKQPTLNDVCTQRITLKSTQPSVHRFLKNALKMHKTMPRNIYVSNSIFKPEEYEKFCLMHSVREFIAKGQSEFGYSNLEKIFKGLDKLSDPDLADAETTIKTKQPLTQDYPKATTHQSLQVLLVGIVMTGLMLHETKSPLCSILVGLVSAYLTHGLIVHEPHEKAMWQDEQKRTQRMKKLMQHERFFKSQENTATAQTPKSDSKKVLFKCFQ